MTSGIDQLSDKERETLRLMLAGHDAKSIAATLGLLVHTINDRLHSARRKTAAPSGRAAARMLLAHEGAATRENRADQKIGVHPPSAAAQEPAPSAGFSLPRTAGVWIMGLAFIAGAALMFMQAGSANDTPTVEQPAVDAAKVQAAQEWLALVDGGRTYEARDASPAIAAPNSAAQFAAAIAGARTPLGAVQDREVTKIRSVPAPPNGYEMVVFRTSFAHWAGAVETVTLERVARGGQVAGYYIY